MGTAFVVFAAPLVWYARVTSQDIRGMAGPEAYRGGVEWLSKNAEKGELILNTDWDDFPKLFFYNPNLAYISGLDPTYLLDESPELSRLYVNITLGKEKDPGPIIRDRFGARYVFTDNEKVHDDFYANAMDSGWFEQVYDDEDCTVLRILDEKGEPPAEFDDEADGGAGDGNIEREENNQQQY